MGAETAAHSKSALRFTTAFLEDLLAPFSILPFDAPASLHAAKVPSCLERKDLGIGPHETLIAGHALSIPAEFTTANTREFSRVPDLKLANWIYPA
jgi:tRNA(fMet)-specific endonuclease VapC